MFLHINTHISLFHITYTYTTYTPQDDAMIKNMYESYIYVCTFVHIYHRRHVHIICVLHTSTYTWFICGMHAHTYRFVCGIHIHTYEHTYNPYTYLSHTPHTHDIYVVYMYIHTDLYVVNMYIHTIMYVVCKHIHTNIHTTLIDITHMYMGWLWLVGSIKLNVSFAKEPNKRDNILQKRPRMLYHIYATCIPHIYHIYTTYIPHVYHIYTTYTSHIYITYICIQDDTMIKNKQNRSMTLFMSKFLLAAKMVLTHTHPQACTHTHIHTHTHTHTHTCARIHARMYTHWHAREHRTCVWGGFD